MPDTLFLIGEFMNLIDACRQKGVGFVEADGTDLNGYAETVNQYLQALDYSAEQIADFWSGEAQLTSS